MPRFVRVTRGRSASAGCRFSDCAQPTEGNTLAIRKQAIASRIPRLRESGTLRESGSDNSDAIVTILGGSQIPRQGERKTGRRS